MSINHLGGMMDLQPSESSIHIASADTEIITELSFIPRIRLLGTGRAEQNEIKITGKNG
jgi:hypothetical protein